MSDENDLRREIEVLTRERNELREALREIRLYTQGLLASFRNGRAALRLSYDGMRGIISDLHWRAQWPRSPYSAERLARTAGHPPAWDPADEEHPKQ